MDVRYSVSQREAKQMDTEALRNEFLITDLFKPGVIQMTYSHVDRIIVGSAVPTEGRLSLEADEQIRADTFLERRELGVINIGNEGVITVDGTTYDMGSRDGLYVGCGAKEVSFASKDAKNPAKFYLASTPAHKQYPTKQVTLNDARKINLGSRAESNVRTINQYVHPDVLESCQLLMGQTALEPENVWNTMPTHLHERRMEVYMYCDLPEDAMIIHLMGEPKETRHLIVRNEQAIISPSWSIHSGVGTTNYTFIWAMAGENQVFTDMDKVGPTDIL